MSSASGTRLPTSSSIGVWISLNWMDSCGMGSNDDETVTNNSRNLFFIWRQMINFFKRFQSESYIWLMSHWLFKFCVIKKKYFNISHWWFVFFEEVWIRISWMRRTQKKTPASDVYEWNLFSLFRRKKKDSKIKPQSDPTTKQTKNNQQIVHNRSVGVTSFFFISRSQLEPNKSLWKQIKDFEPIEIFSLKTAN